MKRLILMLSTAVCLLSSCQNYLDLKPKNQTVVGTLEDVKLMMSSYLFSLTSSNSYPIYFNGVAMRFPYNRDAIASFTMYSDDLDMRRAMGGNTRKNIMNLRIGKVVFSVKPSGIISTCISAI